MTENLLGKRVEVIEYFDAEKEVFQGTIVAVTYSESTERFVFLVQIDLEKHQHLSFLSQHNASNCKVINTVPSN